MKKVKSTVKYIESNGMIICKYSGRKIKQDLSYEFILKPFDIFVADEGLEIVEKFAFNYHKKLKKVILPQSVKKIKMGAFAHSGIIETTVPPLVTEIPAFAYSGCYNLENVTLNNCLSRIEHGAFYGCYSFSGNNGELVLPDSVHYIGEEAFLGTAISSIEVSEDCYVFGEKRDKQGKRTGRIEYELRDENNKKTGEIQTIYIKRRKKEFASDESYENFFLGDKIYQILMGNSRRK